MSPATMNAVIAKEGQCLLVSHALPVAAPGQLLVKISATAANRADCMQRRGRYNPPPGATPILGLEFAGVVELVGPECIGALSVVGTRVMGLLSGGGYAEYVCVDERHVMPVPEGMDLHTAAALPETWLTAYQLLHLVAKVQPGETVLVHAGASGVGLAATQLAVSHGCKVVSSVSMAKKAEFCIQYGATAAVNYKEGPLGKAVLDATGGQGVDVVLDPVSGGNHGVQNAEALKRDGRWVVFGLMGGPMPEGPLFGAVLMKRLQILGTTLRSRTDDYKADLTARLAAHAMDKWKSGQYKVNIDKQFTLAQAQEAHDYMESNASIGKIVITVA